MKAAVCIATCGYLSTLALWVAAAAVQAPAVDLTGTWTGTATDFFVNRNAPDGMRATWVLTQAGATVSGTVTTTGLVPGDGSCSDCHRAKSGTVSGTVSGSSLALTMTFPGGNGEITPTCTAAYSGTAATVADTFTTLYTGTDSCEGLFNNGLLSMTHDPAITAQPISQVIPTGQAAVVSVTSTGTAPLSYQWFRGPAGVTSEPVAGAVLATYTTEPITAASAYWARVISAFGTRDSEAAILTPYQPFVDDVLVAGASVVRAVHVTELRTRIDVVRARFGLGAYLYSDAPLVAGVTLLRAQHIIDLRAALDAAYTAAGRALPVYADAPLTPGTSVKEAHVTQLRRALALIE